MTGWPIAQCIYVIAGAVVTPALIQCVFTRARVCEALREPLPAFIIVVGVMTLWPALLLLTLGNEE